MLLNFQDLVFGSDFIELVKNLISQTPIGIGGVEPIVHDGLVKLIETEPTTVSINLKTFKFLYEELYLLPIVAIAQDLQFIEDILSNPAQFSTSRSY